MSISRWLLLLLFVCALAAAVIGGMAHLISEQTNPYSHKY